jgi:hypothetical protein
LGRRAVQCSRAAADDDDALARGPHAQLGEIHVDVLPVRVKGTSRRVGESVALHAGAVHERSKKAGVHSVRYVGATAVEYAADTA